MKLTDIILTASANLKRAKLRSGLTIVAIFIGALTLTLTNGLGAGISSYIDQQLNSLGAEDVFVIQAESEANNPLSTEPQKYNPEQKSSGANFTGFSPPVITEADIEEIRKVPGIISADPFQVISINYIQGPNNERYVIRASRFIEGTNFPIAAGETISNDDDQPELMLPNDFVSILGYGSPEEAVGKPVTLAVTSGLGEVKPITGTIKAVMEPSILATGEAPINQAFNDQLYAAQTEGLPAAQKSDYTYATAKFPADYSDQQIKDLQATLSDKGFSATTIQDQIGIVKQVIGAIIGVLNFFAAIALLAASFGIINTLLMAVQERTKEIGLMKAMGMSSRKIFLLFSVEAAMLGFWGSLLGVVAAQILGRVANKIAGEGFLKDLIGLELLSFPWQSVVATIALIMLIAFLAGTLPARRAAKQNPIDALRYE